jgi:hypothetical protein
MQVQEAIEMMWEGDELDDTVYEELGTSEAFKLEGFQDIVEGYQGTCDSLSPAHIQFLEFFDLYTELAHEIFECVGCGWWYEICEQGESETGEMVCVDCIYEE